MKINAAWHYYSIYAGEKNNSIENHFVIARSRQYNRQKCLPPHSLATIIESALICIYPCFCSFHPFISIGIGLVRVRVKRMQSAQIIEINDDGAFMYVKRKLWLTKLHTHIWWRGLIFGVHTDTNMYENVQKCIG